MVSIEIIKKIERAYQNEIIVRDRIIKNLTIENKSLKDNSIRKISDYY